MYRTGIRQTGYRSRDCQSKLYYIRR